MGSQEQHDTQSHAARNRFAAILDAIPDLLFEVDLSGCFFAYHSPRTDLLATPAPDFLGRTVSEVLPPEAAAVCLDALREAHETGRSHGRQYELSLAQGLRWFELSVSTLPLPSGEEPRFIVLSRDVTERRRTEDALRESRAQLEAILGSTADGLLAVDAAGRIILANRRLAELWRVPQALLEVADDVELLGHAAIQLVEPEAFLESVRALYGSDAEITDTLLFRDGRIFERFSAPIRLGAKKIGRIWSFRDVTERRRATLALQESEARFRHLANTAPVFIWLADASMRYTWINQRWLDFTGRNLDTLAEGWADLLHPDDRTPCLARLRDACAERVPFTLRYRLRRGDGQYRLFIDQGLPRVTADGVFEGYVGACLDVTEQHEAEAALVAAREAADAANRAKSEFLANMSHEIRTPLNGLLGNIQLLKASNPTPEQREFMAAIVTSGSSLLSLINDILDLSKIDADKVTLEERSFGLRRCIAGGVGMQAARIADKGLALHVHVDDDVPDAITGDELRFRQILSNLLGNALKFTSHGSITVTARLCPRSTGPLCIELAVSDTGIGIPAHLLEDIFSPFVQADSSITRRYGGTGLGLSISRRLAVLMGGELVVESEEGVGSTFRARLPFRPAAPGDAPPTTSSPFGVPPVFASGEASPRVLLADADVLNCTFGAALLEKSGYAVTAVEDPAAALAAAAEGPYEFVLLDERMDDRDLQALLAELARHRAAGDAPPPVIALTLDAGAHGAEALRARGFDAQLPRPLTLRKLAEARRVPGRSAQETP